MKLAPKDAARPRTPTQTQTDAPGRSGSRPLRSAVVLHQGGRRSPGESVVEDGPPEADGSDGSDGPLFHGRGRCSTAWVGVTRHSIKTCKACSSDMLWRGRAANRFKLQNLGGSIGRDVRHRQAYVLCVCSHMMIRVLLSSACC